MIGSIDVPGPKSKRSGAIERLRTIAWSGLENSCRQIISLAFFFVSVRFLHPHDLGVFALANAINALTLVFIDDMIGELLVQKADITLADWDTGFTINLMLAVGFLTLSLAVSWPLARLLGEPSLEFAVPAMSISSLVGALGNMQKAFLGRALNFRLIAQITLTGQMVGGIAGVTLAALGFAYWALIASVAITATVCSAVFWWNSPWKPRLQFDRSVVDSRLHYAASVAAIRFIYLLREFSPLIIAGLLADLAHVGLLSLALRIARSVGLLFEEVTTRPLVSLISREQHDIARFGQVLAEVMTVIGLIALPVFVGLAIVGPLLIPLLFGPNWAAAGLFLPWVCAALGSWLILHIVAVSLRARLLGRTAVILTAAATLLDVALLAALAPLGLEWALIGWAARNVLSIPLSVYMLQTRLGVSAHEIMVRWTPPLIATLVMAGMLVLFDRHYGLSGSIKGLSIMIGSAGLVYIFVWATSITAMIGPRMTVTRLSSVCKAGGIRDVRRGG